MMLPAGDIHNAPMMLPAGDIDDRISALMLLVDLFFWNFKYHFVSVFKIIRLE